MPIWSARAVRCWSPSSPSATQGWFRPGARHLHDVGQVDDEHVRFRLGDERGHHPEIGDVGDDLDLAAAVEDGHASLRGRAADRGR